MTDLTRSVKRVVSLHESSGPVGWTTGGMAICTHCSHGPGIGDEGGSGHVFWPCPTLRVLADIKAPSAWEAIKEFEAWLTALSKQAITADTAHKGNSK